MNTKNADHHSRLRMKLKITVIRRLLASVGFFLLLAQGVGVALAEKPLTNEDVVKMVAVGLGNDIVIAKIRQAPSVKFKLEVDDMLSLRKEGVKEPVIMAMLDRTSPSAGAPQANQYPKQQVSPKATRDVRAEIKTEMRDELGIETINVTLVTSEGKRPIRALRGQVSTRGVNATVLGVGVGSLTFMDYPGLQARLRTRDSRPALLVGSSQQIGGGKFFLAKLDSETGADLRSFKISSSVKARFASAFGGSSRQSNQPDKEWVKPYKVVEAGQDLWQVTPKEDLPPGEYGWFVNHGTRQAGLIFDFGVD